MAVPSTSKVLPSFLANAPNHIADRWPYATRTANRSLPIPGTSLRPSTAQSQRPSVRSSAFEPVRVNAQPAAVVAPFAVNMRSIMVTAKRNRGSTDQNQQYRLLNSTGLSFPDEVLPQVLQRVVAQMQRARTEARNQNRPIPDHVTFEMAVSDLRRA